MISFVAVFLAEALAADALPGVVLIDLVLSMPFAAIIAGVEGRVGLLFLMEEDEEPDGFDEPRRVLLAIEAAEVEDMIALLYNFELSGTGGGRAHIYLLVLTLFHAVEVIMSIHL